MESKFVFTSQRYRKLYKIKLVVYSFPESSLCQRFAQQSIPSTGWIAHFLTSSKFLDIKSLAMPSCLPMVVYTNIQVYPPIFQGSYTHVLSGRNIYHLNKSLVIIPYKRKTCCKSSPRLNYYIYTHFPPFSPM